MKAFFSRLFQGKPKEPEPQIAREPVTASVTLAEFEALSFPTLGLKPEEIHELVAALRAGKTPYYQYDDVYWDLLEVSFDGKTHTLIFTAQMKHLRMELTSDEVCFDNFMISGVDHTDEAQRANDRVCAEWINDLAKNAFTWVWLNGPQYAGWFTLIDRTDIMATPQHSVSTGRPYLIAVDHSRHVMAIPMSKILSIRVSGYSDIHQTTIASEGVCRQEWLVADSKVPVDFIQLIHTVHRQSGLEHQKRGERYLRSITGVGHPFTVGDTLCTHFGLREDDVKVLLKDALPDYARRMFLQNRMLYDDHRYYIGWPNRHRMVEWLKVGDPRQEKFSHDVLLVSNEGLGTPQVFSAASQDYFVVEPSDV